MTIVKITIPFAMQQPRLAFRERPHRNKYGASGRRHYVKTPCTLIVYSNDTELASFPINLMRSHKWQSSKTQQEDKPVNDIVRVARGSYHIHKDVVAPMTHRDLTWTLTLVVNPDVDRSTLDIRITHPKLCIMLPVMCVM